MILIPHVPILWMLCDKAFLALYWGSMAGILSFVLRTLLLCTWGFASLMLHIMPFGSTSFANFFHKKTHPLLPSAEDYGWRCRAHTSLLPGITVTDPCLLVLSVSAPCTVYSGKCGVALCDHYRRHLCLSLFLPADLKRLCPYPVHLPQPWRLEKSLYLLLSLCPGAPSFPGQISGQKGPHRI